MFSDVRGFTTISESLEPKDLAVYINDYLTAMSLIIQSHRGTLDKYIGDAIMAFWGAPVPEVSACPTCRRDCAGHARRGGAPERHLP